MPWDPSRQIPDWLEFVGPGWQALLAKLHRDLLEVDPNYGVLQVKEKFGGLHKICEECGKPGRMTKRRGYYQTLCGRCALIVGATPLSSRGPRRV